MLTYVLPQRRHMGTRTIDEMEARDVGGCIRFKTRDLYVVAGCETGNGYYYLILGGKE